MCVCVKWSKITDPQPSIAFYSMNNNFLSPEQCICTPFCFAFFLIGLNSYFSFAVLCEVCQPIPDVL